MSAMKTAKKTEVPLPMLFENGQRFPVVVPVDRQGSSQTILPGERIIGDRFKATITGSGLRQVLNPKLRDYLEAKDPIGLLGQAQQHFGVTQPAADENTPREFEGKTEDEWETFIRYAPEEKLMTLQKAQLLELVGFFGIEGVDPEALKPDLATALKRYVEGKETA